MGEFRMPSLGADMEAGTLVEWLKRPGDLVRRGDIVAVVETEKGAIEIDIFEEGVIERWLVEPGTTVPVGTPLALIAGAPAAAPMAAIEVPATPVPAPAAPPAVPPPIEPLTATGRLRVSPAARRLAAERGIALDRLRGSGPHGAITYADVLAAAEAPRPGASKRLDLAQMRRAIAAAMARSKREIPHYYLSTTIALGQSLAWLDEANSTRPPAQRLLLAALLLKAVAHALGEAPEFNGFFTGEGFQPGSGIHLGTAIAIRGGGLVAPAIRDADKLSLDALMARLRDLVARARTGALRSSELSDPTITVTNLGERGIEAVFGVIYPPQVALVGFGTPVERPWVVAGEVAARPVLTATLSADHRASDGRRGALFLADIDRRLQSPETL
jgi:pyruvate dehydrogenase E2 component (dihydrolipoamide acetyltransferase)